MGRGTAGRRGAAGLAAACRSDFRAAGSQPRQVHLFRPQLPDHAAEGGHPIPDYPALFMRTATSIVGHGQPLVRPQASDRFDYEAELMVVVGRRCRHASESDALDAVFGYGVFNDGSLRDYQRKSTQWTAGKNFGASGAFGPVIVSKDEVAPGAHGLRIACRINGETLQDGNTADMIFPVARAIALLSEIMTLEPGDLIAMGTPAGVGFARKPPVWLKAGDRCEIEIEGIGLLVNKVVDEHMSSTAKTEASHAL
jgi:2-keto-4-pentenoate hydratase/2-oxohepta-3-ene-1,7-dioic acid hydratase in catechol pathway